LPAGGWRPLSPGLQGHTLILPFSVARSADQCHACRSPMSNKIACLLILLTVNNCQAHSVGRRTAAALATSFRNVSSRLLVSSSPAATVSCWWRWPSSRAASAYFLLTEISCRESLETAGTNWCR
jgi:hypothetical protein